jgi:tRNA modification GTPase
VRVGSKADLGRPDGPVDVDVAAHRGDGIPALLAVLADRLGTHGDEEVAGDDVLAATARQEQGLLAGADAVEGSAAVIADGLPDELACSELRRAAHTLDGLLGTDIGEDVLDVIFSRFCIGK